MPGVILDDLRIVLVGAGVVLSEAAMIVVVIRGEVKFPATPVREPTGVKADLFPLNGGWGLSPFFVSPLVDRIEAERLSEGDNSGTWNVTAPKEIGLPISILFIVGRQQSCAVYFFVIFVGCSLSFHSPCWVKRLNDFECLCGRILDRLAFVTCNGKIII